MKRGRPRLPEEERSHQTAIRLPMELMDRLRKSSGPRGVNEEIRRRLEHSYQIDEVAEVCLVAAIYALRAGNAEWFLKAYAAYWNMGR